MEVHQPQLMRRQYRARPNPIKDKRQYPLPILRSKDWAGRRRWKIRQHIPFEYQKSDRRQLLAPRAVMARINRQVFRLRAWLKTQPPLDWS